MVIKVVENIKNETLGIQKKKMSFEQKIILETTMEKILKTNFQGYSEAISTIEKSIKRQDKEVLIVAINKKFLFYMTFQLDMMYTESNFPHPIGSSD